MELFTLREICDLTGVSRRAIQGYEKAELLKVYGKNQRGYLMYDYETKERIKLIKLFQKLGFSIKEIKVLLELPKDKLKEKLEMQIKILSLHIQEIDDLIQKAYQIIEKLEAKNE